MRAGTSWHTCRHQLTHLQASADTRAGISWHTCRHQLTHVQTSADTRADISWHTCRHQLTHVQTPADTRAGTSWHTCRHQLTHVQGPADTRADTSCVHNRHALTSCSASIQNILRITRCKPAETKANCGHRSIQLGAYPTLRDPEASYLTVTGTAVYQICCINNSENIHNIIIFPIYVCTTPVLNIDTNHTVLISKQVPEYNCTVILIAL